MHEKWYRYIIIHLQLMRIRDTIPICIWYMTTFRILLHELGHSVTPTFMRCTVKLPKHRPKCMLSQQNTWFNLAIHIHNSLLQNNFNLLDMCPSFQVWYFRGQKRDVTAVTSLIRIFLASLGSGWSFLIVSSIKGCPKVTQTPQSMYG